MPRLASASLFHFLWALSITFLFFPSVRAQQTPNAAPGFRSDAVYDFFVNLMNVQRSINQFDFFIDEAARAEWYDQLDAFFDERGVERWIRE